MPRRKSLDGTRKRILEAAERAFSQKGFRATTIADICQMAGANISSVNYYFGDKETLYVEAWRDAFRRSHEKHPPNGGVPPNAPAEERLRGWIQSFLRRVADLEFRDFEIVHMEMANPTGLLFDAIREAVAPMEEALAGLLRELLGAGASLEDIELCRMSLVSQCLNPMVFQKRHNDPGRGLPPPPIPPPFLAPSLDLDLDVERIAEHVFRFTLAGLAGVICHIATRQPSRGRRLTRGAKS